MHRFFLIAGTMAVLAGCSPLQNCLIEADQDQRAISREIETRRLNLQRGFSVELVSAPQFGPGFCPGPAGPRPCMRWDDGPQEVRHRINPAFERERIALLERQLAQAEAQAQRGRAQCQATYPE